MVPLRSPVFHVKHFIVPGKSGNRFHLAGGMDVADQFTGAFLHANAAGSAFGIINCRVVVCHSDGTSGTIFLAKAAANAAYGAEPLCSGAFILVAAGDHNIRSIGDIGNDAPGAGFCALHAMGAFVLVNNGRAILINMNSIKFAGTDAGAQAQAAIGAVQRPVARNLHGGNTILNAHIFPEFVAGTAPAGAADKGDPALLGLHFHAHDRRDAAGLQAGAAGAGVNRGLFLQNRGGTPGASRIAASTAVSAWQAIQNQCELGVAFDFKNLGSDCQDKAKYAA